MNKLTEMYQHLKSNGDEAGYALLVEVENESAELIGEEYDKAQSLQADLAACRAENERLTSALAGIESVRQMQVRNIERLQTQLSVEHSMHEDTYAELKRLVYARPEEQRGQRREAMAQLDIVESAWAIRAAQPAEEVASGE